MTYSLEIDSLGFSFNCSICIFPKSHLNKAVKIGTSSHKVSLEWYTLKSDHSRGFPGGSDGKVSACNAGDPGSIPGLGRSPGVGNGNPLQYSCLENSTDGGSW